MKKYFLILMAVAVTAGCGPGTIDVECDDSFETLCDGSVLYQVDLCGNSTALGKCENGCNLEFTGCQTCEITVAAQPAERAGDGFEDLPEIEPNDR